MSYEPYNGGQQNFEPEMRNSEYRWSYEDYEAANRTKPPKRRRVLSFVLWTIVILLVLAVLGLSVYGAYSIVNDKLLTEEPFTSSKEENESSKMSQAYVPEEHKDPGKMLTIIDAPDDDDEGLSTVDIAKKVRASVVGISIYKTKESYIPSGYGSGIIMNDDGYIITNHHVVDGALGINVELENGETYVADIIGTDERTDIAVIRIDAEGLLPAEFGNSDELLAGERIVAIGNPGGMSLAGTVTQGIVSALNRNISNGTYNTSYIQTDAAINPGNSGGALINIYGQVVGINTAKIMSIDYEGIGFAIPINEAKPIIDSLIKYGDVYGRVKMGLTGQEIDEAASELNGVPVGIYIWSIEDGSPLVDAGITIGDIITYIDGSETATFSDIGAILKKKSPGNEIVLTVYRAGKGINKESKTFEAIIALMEDLS